VSIGDIAHIDERHRTAGHLAPFAVHELDDELAARVERRLQQRPGDHAWIDGHHVPRGMLALALVELPRRPLGERLAERIPLAHVAQQLLVAPIGLGERVIGLRRT